MTHAERLYRVWLERELGHITTEEAFERVDEILDGHRPSLPSMRRIPYLTKAPGPKWAEMRKAA